MARGQELSRQGKTEDARLLFEKALQADPENATAHAELAQQLKKQGRTMQALEHFRSAAAGGNTEYLIELARAQLQAYLENPAAAGLEIQVKDSSRKLESLPSAKAERSRIEGYLAVMERSTEDAIRHFDSALSQNPNMHDVRLSLLQQLLANGQDAKAEALIVDGPFKESLADTFYLHTLAKSGCKAGEAFLLAHLPGKNEVHATLKRAAHERRCAGPAAEEVILAPLRNKPNLSRTEAILLGDYDAQQSNWAQALAMYTKADQLSPDAGAPSGGLELRRSSALIGIGEFQQAATLLDSYIAQHPQDANAKGQRGLLRLNGAIAKADPASGLNDLREALASPDSKTLPSLRLQLAMNLVRLGFLQEARRELQELSRLTPGVLALSLLGAEVELREGRPQSAEKITREILVQAPKQREARLIRALSLVAMQKTKEATAELQKLAQEFPDDESIMVQFLAVLAEDKSPSAKQNFDRIIKQLDEQSNLTHQTQFLLAEILFRTGKMDRAVKIWQALAESNADLNAQLRLTEIALSSGQAAAECSKLRQQSKSEPNWAQPTRAKWWALKAICLESDQDLPAAIEAHRKALELSPNDPVYSNNLASALADHGSNLDEALQLANNAVKLQPDNVQYLDTQGWVYHRKGDQNRATQIYQRLRAQGSLPPNVSAHSNKVLGTR